MDWSTCTEGAAKVATLKCVPVVFHNLINAALVFAGIVAVIFVIVAGYKYLTSGGDAKKLEGAQKTLTYTIIGLILIVFSFFIVNVISAVTGVSCIKTIGLGNCSALKAGSEDTGNKNGKGKGNKGNNKGGKGNNNNGGNKNGKK